MGIKNKLYHITNSGYELPMYVDSDHSVKTTDASEIPMLLWPDGSWCLPGNVYILELFKRGLSRKNRGGTLLTYATNISHLLRYVFDNKINLPELTDNEFSLFIKLLQGERRVNQPEVFARNANTVISIGRNCLDFLASVGRLYQIDNLIGPGGQIYAEQKEFEVRKNGVRSNSRKLVRKYWHHRSFPAPDPKITRLPISTTNIEKIRTAIQKISSSIYLLKRRYVMLKLLEITGGRRSEVAAVTCESVKQASLMSYPELKLITVKRRGVNNQHRLIPIASHDVAFLMEFISINRKRIIRSTCGVEKDDGFLLINERTGKNLRPNTITQEVSLLANACEIREKSCPHMFRHRFITKIFVALIEQYHFENPDNFRHALLDTESLKQKVQQLSGHSSIQSLDPYIHLAFEEVANFKSVLNIVNAKQVITSFQSTLNQLKEELISGISPVEIIERLEIYINALSNDLENCQQSIGQPS